MAETLEVTIQDQSADMAEQKIYDLAHLEQVNYMIAQQHIDGAQGREEL